MTSINLNRFAFGLVRQRLKDLGISFKVEKEGRRVCFELEDEGVRRRRVFVKSKRIGNWHLKLGNVDPTSSMPDGYWVFALIEEGKHTFFIVPDPWLRRDVHEHHQTYLNKHGGRRAENDDSDHHSIATDRLLDWRERWDLLTGNRHD